MLSAAHSVQEKGILENLKRSTNSQQFATWFQCLQLVEITDKRVVMSVPSHFHRDWIITYYRDVLESSIHKVLGQPRDVHLRVGTTNGVANGTRAALPRAPEMPRKTGPEAAPPAQVWEGSALVEGFSFGNFVAGGTNQMSCAAALSIATSPETDFSTLLILGGAGLGKTHLLHAICHKALTSLPSVRIVAYIKAEQFINDFMAALDRGETARFRDHYRPLDVVCFDDLHLLTNKDATQQELLHTLDSWNDRRARVIFAASSSLSAGLDLSSQLLSRLSSAFRVTLRSPEPQTRREIVLLKAVQRGEQIPADVADFMAELPVSSVRELEGATTRVIASSRLMGVPISLRTAREILQDDALMQRPSASPERILRTVCQHFNITSADLCSKRRHQALSFARQFSMYLLRERTELSLSEIGSVLGSRDHTTILHGIRKIDQCIEEPRVRDHLLRLRSLLDG